MLAKEATIDQEEALESSSLSKESRLGELHVVILILNYEIAGCMKSMGLCLYVFLSFITFLDFSQKSPDGVLKPPGDTCILLIFSGFIFCDFVVLFERAPLVLGSFIHDG